MKRYSVAPSSSRRKSTINAGPNEDSLAAAREELERLEQETTLVLQEIDKNISRGNAIINDRLVPVIKDYSKQSQKVWNNAGFWKYFFEQSANVELKSYEDPITSNTDVNTIANSKNNNLLYDELSKPIEIQDAVDSTDELPKAQPQNLFKKPLLRPDEATPTWSELKNKQQQQQQSSTPQLHKQPSLLPSTSSAVFDSNDSSIGIQPPQLHTSSLLEDKNADPRNKNSYKYSQSDHLKQLESPIKTQTVRQSLDAYQRISISPRKRTPKGKVSIEDSGRRRSSIIQELLNSSPTLPEPPILRSELAYSDSSSPRRSKNIGSQGSQNIGSSEGSSQAADNSKSEKNIESLSPVILPPELSPTKSFPLLPAAPHTAPHTAENTLQRFPTTPKFSDRLSGGSGANSVNTPLKVLTADDSDLQPPELQNKVVRSEHSFEDEEVPTPDLQTIELRRSPKRQKTSNVFIEKQTSAGSTVYHSIVNKEDSFQNNTNESNQSRSMSYLFEEVSKKVASEENQQRRTASPVIVKDIFSEVQDHNIPLLNVTETTSQQDNTVDSTSEMGPTLRERYRTLTRGGKSD